jgi:hypothetical protein
MKKILVVFNCSGIRTDLIQMWLTHLSEITEQNYNNFIVCLSGCRVSPSSKNILHEFQKNFPFKLYMIFYEDIHPVNVTFNKTCQLMNEIMDFDGYMYVASDVGFGKNKEGLRSLVDLHFSNNYGITSAVVDYDSGIVPWMGEKVFNEVLNEKNYEVPIGLTCNLHCMIFDKQLFESYNKKILPDIFRTYCTESVFSFLTASIGKKMVIHNKSVLLTHLGHVDGSSAGFPVPADGLGYRDLYLTNLPVEEKLMTEEAKECGFGYERDIFPPNMLCYDENQNHKDPSKLLDFCKKTIYLTESELNYNEIPNLFYKWIN